MHAHPAHCPFHLDGIGGRCYACNGSRMVTTSIDPIDDATRDHVPLRMSSERLLGLAERWRELARYWASLANAKPIERAERLRVTAQAALYAAWRAEELAKRRAGAPPRSE